MSVIEKNRITDGFRSLERGVNSGISPSLLARNQCAFSVNTTMRGGFPRTRPKFLKLTLAFASTDDQTFFTTQNFQGAVYYDPPQSDNDETIVCSIGGRVYRINIVGMIGSVVEITLPADRNPANIDKAFFLQAEGYLIVQDGSSRALIYDGATSRRAASDEVPPGTCMAYGLGRIWVAINGSGREFVAGDILGGVTGILKFTENTYLNGGGSFVVPLQSGSITAMLFTAQIDSSTGQGQLLVCTQNAIYSVQVPIDRTQWQNLTDPIMTICLIKYGALSQNSTILVNGDTYFRSVDGIRSLIIARREFYSWGNVPMSTEMNRIIDLDDASLLRFSSAVLFDNRLLVTASPAYLPYSCFHRGLIALDFHLMSAMGTKTPPAYDGLWTGLQILQLVTGKFAQVDRCFALSQSETDGFVANVIMLAYGSGYTSLPTVTIAGGATGTAVMSVVGATKVAGGAGYAVGDILTIVGGTHSVVARLVVTTVAAGVVTGVSILSAGSYTALPANAVATTGAGAGATFNLSWGVSDVTITNPGTNYSTAPAVSFSGGGGTGASAIASIGHRKELWEITKEYGADNNLTRIEAFVETGSYDFPIAGQLGGSIPNFASLKRLETADIWIDDLVGQVDWDVKFRPDQYPCWVDWITWTDCAKEKWCPSDDPAMCKTVQSFKEQYRPRQTLPQPPDSCESAILKPYRMGYEFQFRIQWTGNARLKLFHAHALVQQENHYLDCPTIEACVGEGGCCNESYGYNAGGTVPPTPTCPTGYYWNGVSCVVTPVGPPTCEPGFHWDGAACVPDCLVPNVVFEPPTGRETATYPVLLTLSCADAGATIHYTTDGSTPTGASATYTVPILVASSAVTVKAIAIKGGCTNSAVTSGTYPQSTVMPTFAFYCSNADKVGIYGQYTPDGRADYLWKLRFVLGAPKEILRIELYQTDASGVWNTGQAWATGDSTGTIYPAANLTWPAHISTDPFAVYPLAVEESGIQLNSMNQDSLGTFGAGTHDFNLYGQPFTYPGGYFRLIAFFADGSKYEAFANSLCTNPVVYDGSKQCCAVTDECEFIYLDATVLSWRVSVPINCNLVFTFVGAYNGTTVLNGCRVFVDGVRVQGTNPTGESTITVPILAGTHLIQASAPIAILNNPFSFYIQGLVCANALVIQI